MTEEVRKRKGHESFRTKLKIPLRPPSPFYPELKAYSRTLLYRLILILIHWDTTLYRAHLSFVPGIQKSLTFFLHSFRLEWLPVNGHFFSCPRDSRRTVRLTNTETLSIVCQKVFLNVKYLQMHDSMSMSLLRLSGYVTSMNRVYKLSGAGF